MAFKSFERSTLVLSMTVLSTLGVAKTHARNGNAYFQINETGKVLKSNITLKTVLKNTEIPAPPPPPRPNK